MSTQRDQAAAEAIRAIREHAGAFTPQMAVVLGSGLGGFADHLKDRLTLSATEIPNYPRATIEGHKGELVFGSIEGRRVLALRGRTHFYESGEMNAVLFPIRLAALLGTKTLIITNAAGGINRSFVPGDLMVITDQINLTGEALPPGAAGSVKATPLYGSDLIETAKRVAAEQGIRVVTGVYAGVKGPSYETAAEIEMIHRLGGDAVGMSTVMESALAATLGMRILGISCITNKATGTSAAKLDHAEVTEVAARVRTQFSRLLESIIARL